MAINKTIPITWKGEEHKILITMLDVDRIEEEFNIMKFVSRLSMADMRFSHAAKFVSLVLTHGGCAVTQEEVYTHIFTDENDELQPEMVEGLCWTLVSCCFPEIGQKKTTSGKKKKTQNKATPGKNSTK